MARHPPGGARAARCPRPAARRPRGLHGTSFLGHGTPRRPRRRGAAPARQGRPPSWRRPTHPLRPGTAARCRQRQQQQDRGRAGQGACEASEPPAQWGKGAISAVDGAPGMRSGSWHLQREERRVPLERTDAGCEEDDHGQDQRDAERRAELLHAERPLATAATITSARPGLGEPTRHQRSRLIPRPAFPGQACLIAKAARDKIKPEGISERHAAAPLRLGHLAARLLLLPSGSGRAEVVGSSSLPPRAADQTPGAWQGWQQLSTASANCSPSLPRGLGSEMRWSSWTTLQPRCSAGTGAPTSPGSSAAGGACAAPGCSVTPRGCSAAPAPPAARCTPAVTARAPA